MTVTESKLSQFKLEFEYSETDADFKALMTMIRRLNKKGISK